MKLTNSILPRKASMDEKITFPMDRPVMQSFDEQNYSDVLSKYEAL